MNKPFKYVAVDGNVYETTTLRELGVALLAVPFVLAGLAFVGAIAVCAVAAVAFAL